MKTTIKTGLENYTIELLNLGTFKTKGKNVYYAMDALKDKLKLTAAEIRVKSAFLVKPNKSKVDVSEYLIAH